MTAAFGPATTAGYEESDRSRLFESTPCGNDDRLSDSSGQSAVISLNVYDLPGRVVAVLVNDGKSPGSYEVRIEAC
jgi:hypothetical protein